MKRHTFIENKELKSAMEEYFSKLNIKAKTELVSIYEAKGRVTGEAVYAKISSPSYNACAMDGIAVDSKMTKKARPTEPLLLKKGEYVEVNTGNVLPKGFDGVIMIEDVVEEEDGVRIKEPAAPFQHVRVIGEDIVETEMIIPSGHEIRPVDIGAMLAGGIDEVLCIKKPIISILPTGTEIVENSEELEPGKVLDSNSYLLKGLAEEAGAVAKRYSPVEDEPKALTNAIKELADKSDMVLIVAGSSAGKKDYTRAIIEDLGEVIQHGIAIKPGKPTILGKINDIPTIGIPGYPVSAYISYKEFAEPIIYQLSGKKIKTQRLKTEISVDIHSSLKYAEFLRLNIGRIGEKYIATPLQSGAGVSMSLVRADGLGIIPQNIEGIEKGESIEVLLLKDKEEIDEKLIITGSHDVIMDLIGDRMAISSTHVGSMGGILAMRSKLATIAPIHLLDPETGEYNIPYIKKYLDEEMVLIKGVKRSQGLMVQKGNPKNIKGFEDLVKDISFINRQAGAGTRILLDYHLEKLGIDKENINGYENPVTTHMNVAQAIRSGDADTGLGAYSAALALDLDFIEIDGEEYDFLLRKEDLKDKRVKNFIEVLKSEEFKKRVKERGGYEVDSCGEIVYI